MAKSKQARAAKKQQEIVQQPTPPAQDSDGEMQEMVEEEDDESEAEIIVDGEIEKDETEEEELERLVFGDSTGFREGLRDFDAEDTSEPDYDATTGFEGLDDAQVGQRKTLMG
jgi:hypothetical protein